MCTLILFDICRVRTLFQRQISRTFPGLLQDSDLFFKALKFTLTSTIPRPQCQFSLLPSIQFIFLAAFHRFPGLSRTSGLFPGLSSLENAIIKFQDFPGFPGPVRTLHMASTCMSFSKVPFKQQKTCAVF